jgi:hypothetical protein
MSRKLSLIIAAGSLLVTSPATAKDNRDGRTSHQRKVSDLQRYLRAYMRDPNMPKEDVTRYVAANVPGTDLIVAYMDGVYVCGTSGCDTLVLQRKGRSFEIVGHVGIGWPPITLLPTKHHNMPDFSVWVEGGGIRPGYQVAVRFDGTNYSDAVMPTAHKISPKDGRILIADRRKLRPLYN